MAKKKIKQDNFKVNVFISGKVINLIVLDEEIIDKSNWFRWFNDEETTMYMQKHYYPNTKELQKKYFLSEILNNNKIVQLGIFHKKDRILIGVISLNGIGFVNRCCEISGLIGEKKYRNFHNWLEASKLMIIHGFNTLNMNRISGGAIKKQNEEMYVKVLGFTHEGIMRKSFFKNGRYHDTYVYGILKSEFEQFKFYDK